MIVGLYKAEPYCTATILLVFACSNDCSLVSHLGLVYDSFDNG